MGSCCARPLIGQSKVRWEGVDKFILYTPEAILKLRNIRNDKKILKLKVNPRKVQRHQDCFYYNQQSFITVKPKGSKNWTVTLPRFEENCVVAKATCNEDDRLLTVILLLGRIKIIIRQPMPRWFSLMDIVADQTAVLFIRNYSYELKMQFTVTTSGPGLYNLNVSKGANFRKRFGYVRSYLDNGMVCISSEFCAIYSPLSDYEIRSYYRDELPLLERQQHLRLYRDSLWEID